MTTALVLYFVVMLGQLVFGLIWWLGSSENDPDKATGAKMFLTAPFWPVVWTIGLIHTINQMLEVVQED